MYGLVGIPKFHLWAANYFASNRGAKYCGQHVCVLTYQKLRV